jgi:predicted TIM-barrel fold metal-dependent hydrolase
VKTYAAPTLEYIFDSTRNMADLIMTGTAARYSEVKWIIAHCGAALPSILTRLVTVTSAFGFQEGSDRTLVPYDRDNATALLRRLFWFDLAGWPMDDQIYGIRRLFGAERFLYGTDVPFAPFAFAIMLAEALAQDLPDLFNRNRDDHARECRGIAAFVAWGF